MANTNNYKNVNKALFMAMLIVLFTFIVPFEIGNVYGAEGTPTPDNTPKGETAEEIASSCRLSYNVKDSIVMSAMTLCLPGILEKIQELRSIEARKIKCTYRATLNNLDSAYCEKVSTYEQCTFVVGEIFALPFVNALEQLRQIVASVLLNPLGYIWSFGVKAARKTILAKCEGTLATSGSCNAGKSWDVLAAGLAILVTDALALADMIQQISDNGFKKFIWDEAENEITEPEDFGGETGSKNVYDIKEEMQKIVDTLNENERQARANALNQNNN